MELKLRVLNILQKNARLPVSDIAKMTSAEPAEVEKAIADLEKERAIAGYAALVDWSKVAEQKVAALIEVKVVPQRGVGFDMIALQIAQFDEVDSVALISGGFDFMVEINGRSMNEVSQFVFEKLSALDAIQSTATHFVLKKYKDHGIMTGEKATSARRSVVL